MSFRFEPGSVPLLVSFPHSGTDVPESILDRMTSRGHALPDTDWHLPRLYQFIEELGVSMIEAHFSRYVIDPNRSPDDENLYPGKPTPQLCPVRCFDGSPVYLTNQEPDSFEIGKRTSEYWQPWHDRVREELIRLRHVHGAATLFDAHSIRSEVPRLFDGQLPDINIGTARGMSCHPELESRIESVLKQQTVASYVINGRFVGGYITRHYGKPEQNVHAVQLELSQSRYMDEVAGEWDDKRAAEIRPILRQVIESILDWTQSNARK